MDDDLRGIVMVEILDIAWLFQNCKNLKEKLKEACDVCKSVNSSQMIGQQASSEWLRALGRWGVLSVRDDSF